MSDTRPETPREPGGGNRVPRALTQAREQRAVQLRLLGFTYSQIAAAVLPCVEHRPDGMPGCPDCQPLYRDKAAAHKAVTRILMRDYSLDDQSKAQLRAEHLGALRLLQTRATRAAIAGDWEAARVALRALDSEAKVLGLYAPTRLTVNSELDAEIAQLMERLTAGEGVEL